MKNSIKGFIAFILYFVFQIFKTYPFYLLNINYNLLSTNVKVTYSLIYDFIMIIIYILVFNKEIINNFKDFIKNFKFYFTKYFIYWFLLLSLMILSNKIIQVIYPNSIALNEESIRQSLVLLPFYTLISGILIAPIMEEIVFRFSIKKIFKNKFLFIFISGLVFGLMHLIGNVNNFYDLLYIFPYSIPGFILAYVYYDSDNICVSIMIHLIHNTVLLLLQFYR